MTRSTKTLNNYCVKKRTRTTHSRISWSCTIIVLNLSIWILIYLCHYQYLNPTYQSPEADICLCVDVSIRCRHIRHSCVIPISGSMTLSYSDLLGSSSKYLFMCHCQYSKQTYQFFVTNIIFSVTVNIWCRHTSHW